jgi:hypothetical protein
MMAFSGNEEHAYVDSRAHNNLSMTNGCICFESCIRPEPWYIGYIPQLLWPYCYYKLDTNVIRTVQIKIVSYLWYFFQPISIQDSHFIICIINWVVHWLTAVVSDSIPRVWQNMYFYCSNYVGNQFIIAIRHLRGLWYIANVPQLRAVSRHSALRHAKEQSLAVVYWPYTTPPGALLLNYIVW